jgi:hypothetical protein
VVKSNLLGLFLIALVSLIGYVLWESSYGRAFLIWFNHLGE